MSEQIAVMSADSPVWVAKTTDKGDALLAKLAEGHTLDITRALSGSGSVDVTLLKQQTTVSNPQQTVTIHPVAYPEAKKCKLPITITNAGLASSYNCTQIGIYANDPDEGEILYFLAQSTDGGTTIKSEALQFGYSADFDFYVGFGDADGVNVTVDPSNSVTQEAMENYVGTAIVAAQQKTIRTGGTGSAYTATVPGITVLKPGVSFVMMPHVVSTTASPTLDVNGLGAKAIRQPLTMSTGGTTMAASASWLSSNRPVRVMYDGTLWKVEMHRPSAASLYGTVGIENGGTDADTVEGAQKNLQVAPAIHSDAFPGCYYRTVGGETEWINPPMKQNVEYRTTERYMGNPVYTKLITMDFGGGNTGAKVWTREAVIEGARSLWVESMRYALDIDGTMQYDYAHDGSVVAYELNATSVNSASISITCDLSESQYDRAAVYTQVKYTK